jgi:hypothetical protein
LSESPDLEDVGLEARDRREVHPTRSADLVTDAGERLGTVAEIDPA